MICIRRALGPKELLFETEIHLLCSRVLTLAGDARVYLPLGANWMLVGLMVVWCAVKDTDQQFKIEQTMREWRNEALSPAMSRWPVNQLNEMYQCLSLENRDPLI